MYEGQVCPWVDEQWNLSMKIYHGQDMYHTLFYLLNYNTSPQSALCVKFKMEDESAGLDLTAGVEIQSNVFVKSLPKLVRVLLQLFVFFLLILISFSYLKSLIYRNESN